MIAAVLLNGISLVFDTSQTAASLRCKYKHDEYKATHRSAYALYSIVVL